MLSYLTSVVRGSPSKQNIEQTISAKTSFLRCRKTNSSFIEVRIVSICATELPIPRVKSIIKNKTDQSWGTYFILLKASGYTTKANPIPN